MLPFDPFEDNVDSTPPSADHVPFSADEMDWLTAEMDRLAVGVGHDSAAPSQVAFEPETYASVALAVAPPEAASEVPPVVSPPVIVAPRMIRSSPKINRHEHLYGWPVRNTTTKVMPQVVVRHELPANTRCVGVSHGGKIERRCLVWQLGDLAPGATIHLKVKVAPINPALPFSAEEGDFRISYVRKNPIRRPEIKLDLTGPASLEIGHKAEWQLIVRNEGNGDSTPLALAFTPSDELCECADEAATITLEPLVPQEEVTILLPLRGIRAGQGSVRVAVGDMTANHDVRITAPELYARIESEPTTYLDQKYTVRLNLANRGTSPANEVAVEWQLPFGLAFIESDATLEYDADQHRLRGQWRQIKDGQTHTLAVRLQGRLPGDWHHQATITSCDQPPRQFQVGVAVEFDPTEPAKDLALLLNNLDASMIVSATERNQLTNRQQRTTLSEQVIVFSVNATRYAVPITAVLEIGQIPVTTPVPNGPSWLDGVANVRGDIIPVVDLQAFLMGETINHDRDGRLLVLKVGPDVVGMLVDVVNGICPTPTNILPLPNLSVTNPIYQYAAGLADIHEKLVVLLDATRLLKSPQLRQPLGADTE